MTQEISGINAAIGKNLIKMIPQQATSQLPYSIIAIWIFTSCSPSLQRSRSRSASVMMMRYDDEEDEDNVHDDAAHGNNTPTKRFGARRIKHCVRHDMVE